MANKGWTLSTGQADQIRHLKPFYLQTMLAQLFGITQGRISQIRYRTLDATYPQPTSCHYCHTAYQFGTDGTGRLVQWCACH